MSITVTAMMSCAQPEEPVLALPLTPSQHRKRPLSIIEENDSDSDDNNTKKDGVTTVANSRRDGASQNEKNEKRSAAGGHGPVRGQGSDTVGKVKPKPLVNRNVNGSRTATTPTRIQGGQKFGSEPPPRGSTRSTPLSPTSAASPAIAKTAKNNLRTSPVSPKPRPGQLSASRTPERKKPPSPTTSSTPKDVTKPAVAPRVGRRVALTTGDQNERPKSPRPTATSPKPGPRVAVSKTDKAHPSPLSRKSKPLLKVGVESKTPSTITEPTSPKTETARRGGSNIRLSHSPPATPGDGHGLERIREQAQQLKLSSSSSPTTSPSPTPSPKLIPRFHILTDQSSGHTSTSGHSLTSPPSIVVSPVPNFSPHSIPRSSLLSRYNSQGEESSDTTNNNSINHGNHVISQRTSRSPTLSRKEIQHSNNKNGGNELPPSLTATPTVTPLLPTATAMPPQLPTSPTTTPQHPVTSTPRFSPKLPRREPHMSPTFSQRFPHHKMAALFARRPSIDSNCSISEESELELDPENTSTTNDDTTNNNNNNTVMNTIHAAAVNTNTNGTPQSSLSPMSPDFLQLQETAHRLRLSTRRPSVLQWRQTYMADSPGFPRSRPDLNGDAVDERLTSDRKQRIDEALGWLRNELHEMRSQDQLLARQLLTIRQDIHQLKLRRSTEEHQDLLDDFQCELEDLQEFSHLLDLHQPAVVNPLKHVGVTRLNLSARRFSAC